MHDFEVNDKVVALGDNRIGVVVGFEEVGYWADRGQTIIVKFNDTDGRSNYFAPYELRLAK